MAARRWVYGLAWIRRRWRREALRRWLRRLLLAPLVLLVVGYIFVEVTALPRFCVTCHYMRPFYDSWKQSSHNQVSCVDCHYPPEVKGVFRRKIQASVQLTKYLSRSYGTRPWTEVDDASCLRSGCHSKRLLSGKVQFGGVEFDHTPHLTSFRRVTRLRCTSCHSQIVQGLHITVTEQTCFLCHFKNPQEDPRLSDCRLCHQEIRPHRREGLSTLAPIAATRREEATPVFDHKPYLERGVDCRFCHTDVVQGDGAVPPSRCVQCHSEPQRLARYNDIWFMHYTHVTAHKIDCFRCHQEIQHRLPPPERTAEVNCQSCHPNFHQETQRLYMGLGPAAERGKPNPMFPGRVPCQGCHMSHKKVNGREVAVTAGAAGCMSCHGEEYGRALANWVARADRLLAWMGHALRRAEGEWQRVSSQAPAEAARLLEKAREDFAFVRHGNAVHNVDFAEQLLQEAARRIDRAMELAGLAYRVPPMPRGGMAALEEKRCADCHTGASRLKVAIYDVTFDHGTHVLRAGLPCGHCHAPSTSPQEPQHGRLLLTQAQCQQCHLRQRPPSPHPPDWLRAHGGEARRTAQGCRTCHSQQDCTRCHGLPMPHPSGWTQGHGPAVERQPGLCARCHETPKDCLACHAQRPPRTHTSSWRQEHGRRVAEGDATCTPCHSKPPQASACLSCHGLPMPHPPHWTLAGHKQVARSLKDPTCLQCHQPSYCALCHGE